MTTTDFDRDFVVLDELDAEACAPPIKVQPQEVQRSSRREQLLQRLDVDPDLVEVLYPEEEQDNEAALRAPHEQHVASGHVKCPRCGSMNLTREECFARCADCAIWRIVHAGIQGVPECYVLPWSEFSRIPQK